MTHTAIILLYEDGSLSTRYFKDDGPRYSDLKRRDGLYEYKRGNRARCVFRRVEKYDSPYNSDWVKVDVWYEFDRLLQRGEKPQFDNVPWEMIGERAAELARRKLEEIEDDPYKDE